MRQGALEREEALDEALSFAAFNGHMGAVKRLGLGADPNRLTPGFRDGRPGRIPIAP